MSTRKKALLAVLIGNGIFGFSFLFSQIALEMTLPGVMLAARFVAAFLMLNLIIFFGRIIKKKNGQCLIEFSLRGKPLKYVILLAVFQPVIYFFAESYGISYTSSAFAGTIIAVIPIMGITFDVLIMRAKVTGKQIVCSAASVIGVAMTTLGAEETEFSVLGTILLFVAVAAGALFYVFSKKAGKYYNPLEKTYVMFAVGSIVFVMLAFVQCEGEYAVWLAPVLGSLRFWVCILYLAVLSSVAAFLLLNYGSAHVSVSEASIFANFTTVISIVAGIAIMRESFTIQQILGAAIIIGSVYISSVKQE